MKKIFSLVLIISMLTAFFSGCGHKHTPGPEATCTKPQICTECGEVLADALGHEPGTAATCTEGQSCLRCSAVITPALGHTAGEEATCTKDQICTVCGIVLVPALGHTTESDVSCTEDEVCTRCHNILKPAMGHNPGKEATCTEDQVCLTCGEVLKKATGHNIGNNGKCKLCGKDFSENNSGNNSSKNTESKTDEQNSESSKYIEETVSNGHYTNDINAYTAGSVLVCGDYGLEYFNPSASGNSTYANIVNKFAEKYPNVRTTCLIIPKSCAYNSPKGYKNPHDSIESFINATYNMIHSPVKTADCMSVMDSHIGEYMFYRTDHHWTGLGAYYASVAYCNVNGISANALSSYKTVVNTGFTGTLYGYSENDANLKRNPDYSVGHYPRSSYSLTYKSGGKWYDGSAINGGSKSYAGMYICGDNPLTVITTNNKNGKNLIIFKESYGNAFVPYMIDYYEQIVVVDIRKETESVASIMNNYGITDALIINNAQSVISHSGYLKSKVLS